MARNKDVRDPRTDLWAGIFKLLLFFFISTKTVARFPDSYFIMYIPSVLRGTIAVSLVLTLKICINVKLNKWRTTSLLCSPQESLDGGMTCLVQRKQQWSSDQYYSSSFSLYHLQWSLRVLSVPLRCIHLLSKLEESGFFQFLLFSTNYNLAVFQKCDRIVKRRYLGSCDEGLRSLTCLKILDSCNKNIRVPLFHVS